MKYLKNNLKVIIAFVLGAILTGGIVYAAVSASEVSYTTNKNANVKSVQDALNDLYTNKVASFDGNLLWKNQEQNQALFDETTLNIDLSNYSSIIILGKYSSYYSQYTGYVKINKGENGTLQIARASDAVLATRNVTVNNNSIVIGNGYASDDTSPNYHFYALPMYIIGIK